MTDQLSAARLAYDGGDDEETLRLLEGVDGATARERARVHNLRAQALFRAGRYAAAARERERELADLAAADADPEYVATIRLGLAWALFRATSYEGSLHAAGQAYLDREAILGPDDAKTLSALRLCISSLDKLGRYQEMLPLTEELYARRVETLGVDHKDTKDALGLVDRARTAAAETAKAAPVTPSSNAAAGPVAPQSKAPSLAVEILHTVVSGASRGITRGLIEGLLG